ncbi:hypothetical protein D7M11_28945 [Paenibacillus ginsengarvi]|uniref:Uncharacterized protein n=2 Tax=Paenibacillus ginsengarvi TaxID=400777 RepID=A0A3B0BGP5_9BACL|nr:hypothetical protein D7M11_28945 [Paenibacillus ginsengarvi]
MMASSSLLRKNVCYIGDDNDYRKKYFWNKKTKTIRQLIQDGLFSNPSHSFDEIVELFRLTPERLDRPIHSISTERYSASAAIGFACGKQVYCFPWLNDYWVERLTLRIENIIGNVKKIGGIVILPTSREQYVQHLVDQMVEIGNTKKFLPDLEL